MHDDVLHSSEQIDTKGRSCYLKHQRQLIVSQDWAFQKQKQSNYFFLQSQHATVVCQDFSRAQNHCLLQHQCEFHFTLYFIALFFSTVVTFGHDLVSNNYLSQICYIVPQPDKAQTFLADFPPIFPTSSEHIKRQNPQSVSGT